MLGEDGMLGDLSPDPVHIISGDKVFYLFKDQLPFNSIRLSPPMRLKRKYVLGTCHQVIDKILIYSELKFSESYLITIGICKE